MEGSRSETGRDREACCEERRSTGLQPLVRRAIGGRVLCLPTMPRHQEEWKLLRAMMPRTRPVGIWGKRKCVTEGCRQSADNESRRRGQLQTPRSSPKQQGESLNNSLRLLSGCFPMRPMGDRAMSRPAKMQDQLTGLFRWYCCDDSCSYRSTMQNFAGSFGSCMTCQSSVCG